MRWSGCSSPRIEMTTLDAVAVGLSGLGIAVTTVLFVIHRLRHRR